MFGFGIIIEMLVLLLGISILLILIFTIFMSEQVKKQSLSPGFFFLSLGVIVTLITSVATSLSLFFDTLSRKMPDVLNSTYQYGYQSYSYESIRSALATLIIVFPIFLIISFFWWKKVKKGLSGWNETIFKWMIYLILFLATIVFIVDLVTLVNYFVSGEITNRFIWKVLGTAAVAGLVWASYYLILKSQDKSKSYKLLANIYLAIAIALFFALIVFAFRVMGSPKEQRALRLDERRVNDLQSIQWQVINFYQQKKKLPANLEELKDPLNYSSLPIDPEFQSGRSYEYAKKGDLTFELCGTFSADRPKGWVENLGMGIEPMMYADKAQTSIAYPAGVSNDSWDHGVGRTCFERTIDPEIYKPFGEK